MARHRGIHTAFCSSGRWEWWRIVSGRDSACALRPAPGTPEGIQRQTGALFRRRRASSTRRNRGDALRQSATAPHGGEPSAESLCGVSRRPALLGGVGAERSVRRAFRGGLWLHYAAFGRGSPRIHHPRVYRWNEASRRSIFHDWAAVDVHHNLGLNRLNHGKAIAAYPSRVIMSRERLLTLYGDRDGHLPDVEAKQRKI